MNFSSDIKKVLYSEWVEVAYSSTYNHILCFPSRTRKSGNFELLLLQIMNEVFLLKRGMDVAAAISVSCGPVLVRHQTWPKGVPVCRVPAV